MPTVQVSEQGQLTLPKKFLEVLGLQKGGEAEAELEGERLVITPKKSTKEKDWSKLFSVMDKVHQQNKGVREEDVIRDVEQAVDEVRAEEYAKRKS